MVAFDGDTRGIPPSRQIQGPNLHGCRRMRYIENTQFSCAPICMRPRDNARSEIGIARDIAHRRHIQYMHTILNIHIDIAVAYRQITHRLEEVVLEESV